MKTVLHILFAFAVSFGNAWAEDHPVEPVASSNEHPPLKESTEQMIDRLVRLEWQKQGLTPSKTTEDWGFLRRASLDFMGRVPSVEEREAFERLPAEARRAEWCDYLVKHPDSNSYMARMWGERLQGNRANLGSEVGRRLSAGMTDWKGLAESLLEGSASTELRSTLQGEPTAPGLRFSEGFFDLTPAVQGISRAFLGKSLECTQCHDHMFEPYKQSEYWGFNALFRRLPNGEMPKSLTYEDFNKKEKTTERGFFGAPFGDKDSIAKLITENPDFARAIVNQLWAQIFGLGLNAPYLSYMVNDPSKEVNFPILLEALAKIFKESGYDQKILLGAMCKSQIYSIQSETDRPDQDKAARFFATATRKPLTASQVVRSLTPFTRLGAFAISEGDFVESGLSPFVSAEEANPPTPKTMLSIFNGNGINRNVEKYWERALREKPHLTKTEAIGRISTMLLGKPLDNAVLDVLTEKFKDPMSPKVMTDITTTLMGSSYFLWNQ